MNGNKDFIALISKQLKEPKAETRRATGPVRKSSPNCQNWPRGRRKPRGPQTKETDMNYKIEQIEGVGPQYAERLSAAGVITTEDLLVKCATPEGRRDLEVKTGLSLTQITTWANQADLMRVSGIGSEFGQLLESSGVDTVKELAQRNPENLVAVMSRVNEEKHLTRVVPAVKTVAKWVENARELEPVLTY